MFTNNGFGLFLGILGLARPNPTQAEADHWWDIHRTEFVDPAIAAGCRRFHLHCINTFSISNPKCCFTAHQSGVVTQVERDLYAKMIAYWRAHVPDGDVVVYSGIMRSSNAPVRGPILNSRPIRPGPETESFVAERISELNMWGVSMCGLDGSSVTVIPQVWVTDMNVDPACVGLSMLDVAVPIYQRCLVHGVVCHFQGLVLRRNSANKWAFRTDVYRGVDLNWVSQSQESTWLERLETETGPINASAARDVWVNLDYNFHQRNDAVLKMKKWRAQGFGLLCSHPGQMALLPQVLA